MSMCFGDVYRVDLRNWLADCAQVSNMSGTNGAAMMMMMGNTMPVRHTMATIDFNHVLHDAPQFREALAKNDQPIDLMDGWYKVSNRASGCESQTTLHSSSRSSLFSTHCDYHTCCFQDVLRAPICGVLDSLAVHARLCQIRHNHECIQSL